MSLLRRRLTAILVVSSLLAVAQAPPQSARDQAWREDVAFFAREFPARQLDFAKLFPRERFDREIDAITRSIPNATDSDLVLLAAIDLRHDANAIAIGEQPGEKINSYGEVRPFTLPHSQLLVQYSTKYFKLVSDGRVGFEPDIAVGATIAEWLAVRDSVLEAAIRR